MKLHQHLFAIGVVVVDSLALPAIVIAVFALTVAACPTPSPPVPPPGPDADAQVPETLDAAPPPPAADAAPTPTVVDAAPAAVCMSACANMSALKCSGLNVSTCPSSLAYTEAHRLIVNDAGVPVTCKCVAKAATKAAVESCGIGCK